VRLNIPQLAWVFIPGNKLWSLTMSKTISSVKTTTKLVELAAGLEKMLTSSVFHSCPKGLKKLEVDTNIYFTDYYYETGFRVNVTLISSNDSMITLQGKSHYGGLVEYYIYKNCLPDIPTDKIDLDHLVLLEQLEELVITLPALLERYRIQQREELCAELEADIMGY